MINRYYQTNPKRAFKIIFPYQIMEKLRKPNTHFSQEPCRGMLPFSILMPSCLEPVSMYNVKTTCKRTSFSGKWRSISWDLLTPFAKT